MAAALSAWLRAAPNLVKEIATGAFKVFSSAAFSTVERSNWVARPGIVGRKNGAALGFLGGAFGLFLALITSRFNRFSHLDPGRLAKVMSSLLSCAGLANSLSSSSSSPSSILTSDV